MSQKPVSPEGLIAADPTASGQTGRMTEAGEPGFGNLSGDSAFQSGWFLLKWIS